MEGRLQPKQASLIPGQSNALQIRIKIDIANAGRIGLKSTERLRAKLEEARASGRQFSIRRKMGGLLGKIEKKVIGHSEHEYGNAHIKDLALPSGDYT